MNARSASRGFTLIEILVSTTVIILLVLILASVTDQTNAIFRRSRAQVEQFREARTGFETLTQRLRQATLNTYWDYDNPELPTRYQRRSELRFTSGQADKLLGPFGDNERLTHCVFFHAPLGFTAVQPKPSAAPGDKRAEGYRGLESLLNCWGYFVEFGSDEALRPGFMNTAGTPQRWRFRLMEFALPTEELATYNATSGGMAKTPKAYSYFESTWFTEPLKRTSKRQGAGTIHSLAENIVALILTPRLARKEEEEIAGSSGGDGSALAPRYEYDSSPVSGASGDPRYKDARLNPVCQLPPLMQVTMVAVDEASAIRLNLQKGSSDIFKVRDKFRDTAEYTGDLRISRGGEGENSLERELINQHVNYRIFTSNVPIRAAKWSRQQTEIK